MALHTYRKKRDFAKTPEPRGATEPARGRSFVVQRHRARALHYDFRLEVDGVLASWAVPRGPTLDPGARRLAMRTEDHPLEYADFEGVIPKGQYGGGDVIVWDRGWYEPVEGESIAAALRDGELRFVLHGERLRGRFTLVRTPIGQSAGEKEKWLLIHKRDDAAVPGWDAEQHPQSVKSGLTNDEVAAGVPAIWDGRAPAAEAGIELTGATPEKLPDFVAPMKATLVDAPFTDSAWLFEVKWDGVRVHARVADGEVRLETRNRQDGARYLPALEGPPDWIDAAEAIVDGEAVALDAAGRASFSLLQSGGGTPAYQVFDIVHYDGHSLLAVPLEDRKRLLRMLLRPHPVVRYADHVCTDGEAFYAAAAAAGLEGIIAKRRDSSYEPGARSRAWLKVKVRPEQEFLVCGYEAGNGAAADLGSLLVAVRDGDQLRYAGRVGSGFTAPTRREMRARLEALEVPDPMCAGAPTKRTAHWVRPQVVVRAAFAEWTKDGLLRQASFKGVDPVGEPARVRREQPQKGARVATHETSRGATPAELKALDAIAGGGVWEIGGRDVKLTNLDKVLFPGDDPVTKRDVIRYYVEIAPSLIPHLAGRPLNVQRRPDGITKPGFWQKAVPGHAPEWVTRWKNEAADPDETQFYVVADHVATLAFLANNAAIELHPWTSCGSAPDQPTFALIDIDPGTRTAWDETVLLARLYKEALDHLGMTGLPKLSGQRGIQVWVPIRPVYSYEDTRDWVEALSRAVGEAAPQLVSWEWAKASRKGRARLDFTQNAIGKTLVAPYSIRPAPGAPVSAPITWDELDAPSLRPNQWSIRTIRDRLAKHGDLFARALLHDQELPAAG